MPPAVTPYLAELDAERTGWYEFAALVRRLSSDEQTTAGYYTDPDWSVRDLTAHVGTWLAEAAVQLQRLIAGTYEGHDVDIDALNDALLEAMHDQPWDICWTQANAGRTTMLAAWAELTQPSKEAAWWIRKAAADHYAEHLPRLDAWVTELVGRRAAAARSSG